MKCLLDTHAYLWWLSDPARLSHQVREVLGNRDLLVYVSVASFWEIAIKTSLGKLSLSREVDVLETELHDDGILLLPISAMHCAGVATLPFHHRDPFDRLLVSQALKEELTLVSRDAALDAYGIVRLW